MAWIAELYFSLGQVGLSHEHIPKIFRVPLEELIFGSYFNNASFANLIDFKNYDIPTILNRRSSYRGHPKPRIELSSELTAKGNLSVCWYPFESDDNKSDWLTFDPSQGLWERPANELIFIHDAQYVANIDPCGRIEHEPIRHYVSYALMAAFEEVKKLLASCFELKLRHDIEMTKDANGHMFWQVVDIEEREETEARQWINDFATTFGLPLTEVRIAMDDPANRNHAAQVNYARISKLYRARAPKLTATQLQKIDRRVTEIQRRWRLLPHWLQ